MSTPAKSISDHNKQQTVNSKQQTADAEFAKVEVLNQQRQYEVRRADVVNLGQSVLMRIKRHESFATITFIRDAAMRKLNRDYRGFDKPTDVLAFAYHEQMSDNEPDHNPDFLGDVIISVETAARYAREQGISFETEINWLVIHGLLHLAGYDHETDNGEMRRLERRLRKELLESGKV